MAPRTPAQIAAFRALALNSPSEFVSRYLFTSPPHIFSTQLEFDEFRAEIAAKLDLLSDAITLVGSARLGFSLNKASLLRPFSDESDLDLAIVSSEVFDATWEELILNTSNYALAGEEDHRRFRRTRQNFFLGYLRPDHLPITVSLSRDWFPRLAGPFTAPVAARHPINAWLFKSATHMRVFYSLYLARIQNDIRKILSARGDL